MDMDKEISGGDTFVFQIDSESINRQRDEANYVVEIDESSLDTNLCVIYFSSNAIYFPNTEESFTKSILNKDYYEWRSSVPVRAYKQIFVRDIYKQWYLRGINNKVSTPPELLNLLQSECCGFKTITCGSSAGGYAAILYGGMLGAERIFAFNPQFELDSLLNDKAPTANPLLYRLKDNAEFRKYYDLNPHIKDVPIYYFVSDKSDWDRSEMAHAQKRESLRIIRIKSAHHGVPIPRVALPMIINASNERLDSLQEVRHNPIIVAIKFARLWSTIKGIMIQSISSIRKKIRN